MRVCLFVMLVAAAVHAAPPVLIRNATVLTVTRGTFTGSVLLRDGRIAAIGEKVEAPADARVIDATGQFAMPGIVDCHSHIAAESINEGGLSVSSMVTVEDVLNPEDIAIYRALAGGVTSLMILHGSANAIGGLNVVAKTRWGKSAREMLIEDAKPSIKLALGENPKRQGNPGAFGARELRYPATRMGVEDVIRQAFTEARLYQRKWHEHREKPGSLPPRRDMKLEPLVEVLEGRRLVHAHCYRSDEILMLLRLADEFGFKIKSLIHVLEGYKVAKEIAAHGAGASTFSDWWAYKVEAVDAIPYNAALLVRKGVLTSINSDSPEVMRHLNTEAAKAMKYGGLTEDEALALITINPAKQMDLGHRIGSLEVGKDADVTIYDRHPLSNYARVQKVLIDGELYFDRGRDLEQRGQLAARRRELLQKLSPAPARGTAAGRGPQ